jgi:hypothetical protein
MQIRLLVQIEELHWLARAMSAMTSNRMRPQ